MTEQQFRKKWLRQHSQYEKIAYTELIEGFRELGDSIPFDFMTFENYNEILEGALTNELFYGIYYNIYNQIGIIHGKRVGKSINQQSKDFTLNAFLSQFEKNLLGWLFNNAADRVVSVRSTYLEYIKEIIIQGRADGKTISQISTELVKHINQRNFYRWQALRIARTETTAAANYASMQAGSVSGIVLEKIWISAIDSRTRRPPKSEFNHLKMNGIRVGQNEKFKVPYLGGFEELEFPGDPKGKGANVINCRCNAALVPKKDKNGRAIRV